MSTKEGSRADGLDEVKQMLKTWVTKEMTIMIQPKPQTNQAKAQSYTPPPTVL